MPGTCSAVDVYSPNSAVVSEKFDSLDCLLNGLQDNARNSIVAKNVRDSVFSLWSRVDEITDSTGVLFKNPNDVAVSVGGIQLGDSFPDSTTMQQMWNLLLYPELNPELTDFSFEFSSDVSGLREIGEIVSINFSSTFDRGSINPQYQSVEPFRTGLPTSFEFNGSIIVGTFSSSSLTFTQSVVDYLITPGVQTFQSKVNYNSGVQPINNKGNNFDVPFPAGSTNFFSINIVGVYPFFSTSVDIDVLTKQPLVSPDNEFFQFDLQPDFVTDLINHRQTFDIPNNYINITGIKQFISLTNQFEWLGGSQANSMTFLNQFVKNEITKTINDYEVDYSSYVYNGPLIGFRQIRLYTN